MANSIIPTKTIRLSRTVSLSKNCVVIVQNRPTQFDVPLYARLHRADGFSIVVFYTQVSAVDLDAKDPEVLLSPQWDHLRGLEYPAKFETAVFALWRQIVALRPAHVVICGWYPRSHALLAILLRLTGVCIGVRSDNTVEHISLSGIRGWIKRAVMSIWLGLYQTWHPVGALARAYLEKLSMVRRPIFYFPYAVDVEWFARESFKHRQHRVELRERYGLAPDDFVVIGVMKWNEREDPLTLLEAVLQSALKVPRIKLLLVGDGPLRDAIHARLATAPNRLVAPGYAKYSELPRYYGIADLFVHPARSEPYGVSVQEAMACGLPVLVSDKVGAAAEFVEENVTGDIFPVGDVDCLARLLVAWAGRANADEVRDAVKRKAEKWSYARTIREFERCLALKS